VTDAGLAVYLEWLRKPVVPETVAADLGQHLMRFSLMENYLERAEVIAFLVALGDALDGFVRGKEVRRMAEPDQVSGVRDTAAQSRQACLPRCTRR
jgi:hypothetical protein